MNERLVTRQEAIEGGLPKYFTGEACKNGHVSERQTISGACLACKASYLERDRQKMAEARAAIAGGSK